MPPSVARPPTFSELSLGIKCARRLPPWELPKPLVSAAAGTAAAAALGPGVGRAKLPNAPGTVGEAPHGATPKPALPAPPDVLLRVKPPRLRGLGGSRADCSSSGSSVSSRVSVPLPRPRPQNRDGPPPVGDVSALVLGKGFVSVVSRRLVPGREAEFGEARPKLPPWENEAFLPFRAPP